MPETNSLSDYLRQLDDQRIERGKFHSLHDLLIISVCALLCGAEGFVDMEEFGKAQRDWLKGLLELPKGIPSHDTFGRVFAALDPAQFAEAFTAWTQSLRESLAGEIDSLRSPCGLPLRQSVSLRSAVAVDGKTLRRSGGAQQSPVHLVSAARPPADLPIPFHRLDGRRATGSCSASFAPRRKATNRAERDSQRAEPLPAGQRRRAQANHRRARAAAPARTGRLPFGGLRALSLSKRHRDPRRDGLL